MAHQSVCWAAQALQSPLFGVWKVAKKLSEMGDYRAGWFLLDDEAVEVDDPTGWERLIPAGISNHNVLPTAEAILP